MTLPDIDSIDSYGGALNNSSPIVDPTTDRDAAAANKAYASIAMATHLVPRAWARITLAATAGAMVLNNHDACWGSLPAVAPTLGRTGTGVFTVTWAASQQDELGVSHTLNFRFAVAKIEGSTFGFVQTSVSANVVTLNVVNTSFVASDMVGSVVDLVVY